jgi:hypothetical protein
MPREMIAAYATLKKAGASASYAGGGLDARIHGLKCRRQVILRRAVHLVGESFHEAQLDCGEWE